MWCWENIVNVKLKKSSQWPNKRNLTRSFVWISYQKNVNAQLVSFSRRNPFPAQSDSNLYRQPRLSWNSPCQEKINKQWKQWAGPVSGTSVKCRLSPPSVRGLPRHYRSGDSGVNTNSWIVKELIVTPAAWYLRPIRGNNGGIKLVIKAAKVYFTFHNLW